MTTQETINLVFSFLGGGLVVALIDWFRATRAEQASRRVAFLSEQIRHLYGPLCALVSHNEAIAKIQVAIDDAYKLEFCNVRWSEDEGTQKTVEAEATATIEANNRYSELIAKNNSEIDALLQLHFGYVDSADAVIFTTFRTHLSRAAVEYGEKRVPWRIYMSLGAPVSYHSEFVKRVKSSFDSKWSELAIMRGSKASSASAGGAGDSAFPLLSPNWETHGVDREAVMEQRKRNATGQASNAHESADIPQKS